MAIEIKRIYEPAEESDGHRVLVDRLWPRGISKQRAAIDEWARDISPSNELRKRYHGRPEAWSEFQAAYRQELEGHAEQLKSLRGLARRGRVTLLYAAKDEQHNNATVLAEVLREGE